MIAAWKWIKWVLGAVAAAGAVVLGIFTLRWVRGDAAITGDLRDLAKNDHERAKTEAQKARDDKAQIDKAREELREQEARDDAREDAASLSTNDVLDMHTNGTGYDEWKRRRNGAAE